MNRWLLLVCLVALPACASHVTPADPLAARRVRLDAVGIRVNEFQSALIQWCGPGPNCAVNTVDTFVFRDLLTVCIDIRRTLRAAATDADPVWIPTVKAAWVGVKPKLDPLRSNPAISAAISAVDAIIGGLQ